MASNNPDPTTSKIEHAAPEETKNRNAVERKAERNTHTGAIPRRANPWQGRLTEGSNQPGRSFYRERNTNIPMLETVAYLPGPTYNLEPLDLSERKFSARSRLFIADVSTEASEAELRGLFRRYGEIGEFYFNTEKNFGFVRLDYHVNAVRAKTELHESLFKGRLLKIYYSINGAAVKVKNLSPSVTNELLHRGFGIFGEIERCLILVDERGRSKGEGIVEFARKFSALAAIQRCHENCYFLTASLRPVIVEPYTIFDGSEGFPEKNIYKGNPQYMYDRRVGPRFAKPGSFQDLHGIRWKRLHDLYRQKEYALQQEMEIEIIKLQNEMNITRLENETEILREQLRKREQRLNPAFEENEVTMLLQQCTMQQGPTVTKAASVATASVATASVATASAATASATTAVKPGTWITRFFFRQFWLVYQY